MISCLSPRKVGLHSIKLTDIATENEKKKKKKRIVGTNHQFFQVQTINCYFQGESCLVINGFLIVVILFTQIKIGWKTFPAVPHTQKPKGPYSPERP